MSENEDLSLVDRDEMELEEELAGLRDSIEMCRRTLREKRAQWHDFHTPERTLRIDYWFLIGFCGGLGASVAIISGTIGW